MKLKMKSLIWIREIDISDLTFKLRKENKSGQPRYLLYGWLMEME